MANAQFLGSNFLKDRYDNLATFRCGFAARTRHLFIAIVVLPVVPALLARREKAAPRFPLSQSSMAALLRNNDRLDDPLPGLPAQESLEPVVLLLANPKIAKMCALTNGGVGQRRQ